MSNGLTSSSAGKESKRKIFDKSALNVISYLESFPEVIAVDFQTNPGVMAHELTLLQKKFDVSLPEDLKIFYRLFNGFSVQWQTDLGAKPVTVGHVSSFFQTLNL